jgi:hypothetical protein
MAVQGRRHFELDMLMGANAVADQLRKIALQMRSERQKIGDYDDTRGPAVYQLLDCACKIGLAKLQEGGFDKVISAFSQLGRNIPHGQVRRLYARAMSEEHEARHTWISEGWRGPALCSIFGK